MIIKCRLTPFPIPSVHGAVVEMAQGYILAINSDCCDIQRRKAFGHEMAHISLDHMHQRDRSVVDCEKEASRHAWEYYRKYRDQYKALVSGATSFELKAE